MSTTFVRIFTVCLLLVTAWFVIQPVSPVLAADGSEATLDNPLGENKTVQDVIVLVISYLLGILGVVALAMVVYGGLQYVYSAGNSDRLQKAKETILWALIGVAIVILSLSIMRFVISAFSS